MQKIINEAMSETLDMTVLGRILPPFCKVVRYDAILRAKTLASILGNKTFLVVLFNVHDTKHRLLNKPGHFFCISQKSKRDGTVVFSSTGMSPDHEIFLTQSDPKLLHRILPKNYKYNNVELQKGNDHNTCWRWMITFAHMHSDAINLQQFQKLFSNTSVHLNSPDQLVTALTLLQLM